MNYSIEYLISLLHSLQNSNGSFSSTNITTGETLDSIYFTSLILISLKNLKQHHNDQLQDITSSAIDFLIANESDTCSWNYYPRTLLSPYPDDIDDTILAIRALQIWQPSYITPARLAQITQLLIQCEEKPGGPYRTWITKNSQNNSWDDVDTVVNYNIYQWLRSHAINLEPLNEFLFSAKDRDTYHSLYYEDPDFVNYLTGSEVLSTTSVKYQNTPEHPLRSVFTTIASVTRQIGSAESADILTINNYITQVISCTESYPFFIEKINSGVIEYSGCKALEIALCIELLSSHINKESAATKSVVAKSLGSTAQNNSETIHITRVRETIRECFYDSELIQDFFVKQFNKLLISSKIQLLLPFYYLHSLKESYQERITQDELVLITAAHSIGLISFTLQDSLCDRESLAHQIPYVSSGILAMSALLHSALYKQSTLEDIQSILHSMNQALLRETHDLQHRYLTREELYLKSFGVVCGIITIVLIIGERFTYTEISHIKEFFKNYLNARQMLDDLHDWYDDLLNTIHTPVTQLLMEDFSQENLTGSTFPINFTTEKMHLHDTFWTVTFPKLMGPTYEFITAAESVIEKFELVSNRALFINLLEPIKHALSQAKTSATQHTEFIQAYEKATLSSGQ